MASGDCNSLPGLPSVGVATLLGATLVLFGPSAPGIARSGWLLATTLCAAAWACFGAARWRRRAALVGVMAATALVTSLLVWDQLARRWPASLDGERVRAELLIATLPSRLDGALEFDAELEIVAPAALSRALRVRLRWPNPPRPLPAPGERWQALVKLSSLPRPSNPGAPEWGREALRDRLQAQGTVLAIVPPQRLRAAAPSLLTLRAHLETGIRDALVDRDAAALIAGLAVGATGAISREQWRVFSLTGTTHLVAISGLHVTLFAALTAWIVRRLWRRLPRLQSRIDREPLAAGAGVMAALGYALLAGFGIPTQRTVVMLAIWWALRLSGRVQYPFDAFGIALFAVWMIDPFAPLSSGFWLSFVAMAVLLVGDLVQRPPSPARGWARRFREAIDVQWRVSLALAPLTLAWFGSVAWLGLLVNLVAIPVFSFALVPLTLTGLALWPVAQAAAGACWRLAEALYLVSWPLLQAITEQPYAAFESAWDPVLLMLCMLVIPLWILPMPGRWRAASVLAFLPWALPVQSLAEGEVIVTVLDAGDGAAVIARTRSHTLVIDTGEVWGSEGRRGATLVAPALRALGRTRIDRLVLSASHGERARGMAFLAQAVPIGEVVAGGEWPDAPRGVRGCASPRRWRWDGVLFETQPMGVGREGVCTVRIAVPEGPAMWLLERADRALDSGFAERLSVTEVVLVPRRGAVSAVDPQWVDRLDAREIIVSAARFDAARERRVRTSWRVGPERVHATARDGAISVLMRARRPVELVRQLERRRPYAWDSPA